MLRKPMQGGCRLSTPAELAHKLINHWKKDLPEIKKEEFATLIGTASHAGLFSRHVLIDNLWVVDTKRYEKYDPVVIKMPKQTAPTH